MEKTEKSHKEKYVIAQTSHLLHSHGWMLASDKYTNQDTSDEKMLLLTKPYYKCPSTKQTTILHIYKMHGYPSVKKKDKQYVKRP